MAQVYQYHRPRTKLNDHDEATDGSGFEVSRFDETQMNPVQSHESIYGKTIIKDDGVGILGDVYNSEIHVHHHHHISLPPLLEDPILKHIAEAQHALLKSRVASLDRTIDAAHVLSSRQPSEIDDLDDLVNTADITTYGFSRGIRYNNNGTHVSQRLASVESALENASSWSFLKDTISAEDSFDSGGDDQRSVSEATFVTCPGSQYARLWSEHAAAGSRAEPEVLRTDEVIIVCDAGGGTTDICSYEIVEVKVTRQQLADSTRYKTRLVIGVDFGTTFSGIQYVVADNDHTEVDTWWPSANHAMWSRLDAQRLTETSYLYTDAEDVYWIEQLRAGYWGQSERRMPERRHLPLWHCDLHKRPSQSSTRTVSPGQSQKAVTLLDRATPCSVESNTDFCKLLSDWVGFLLYFVSVLVLHSPRI